MLLFLGLGPAVQQASRAASDKTLDIYFIDVEGGAATLMVTPQKDSLLMDCGWKRDDRRQAN